MFIVRPETEVVAGAAIEAAREVMASGGGVVLTADLCTGSGAIAACVAKEVPGARVVAVEISETAAALARENCERLVPGRVEVIHADATDPLVLHDLNGQVDVVVSNPPYVPAGAVEDTETSQHEPTVALYGGGPDGLDIPIDVLVRSVALLRTGGVLVMEHDHEQGALLRAAALGAGFKQAETGQDLTGRDRYLRAVR
ncbi:methyltransferase, HemK family [Actinomyces naeslundii str. Howell 279]|uniref:peptide chain release factor N(5)-glutamine methyltransferase n=1 Tax=Actinomyces naeslundii (strain ATCC 12104 / DSM 43013 / CCUG 2238 / JCM 8349 / NCTC 10301 / Howell 279) TaxID=1115803 RepID=J3JK07_ACTNH|nr:methyltransferase, HemK family [Actinomyces naeslundii str. Howell 279]